LPTDFGGPTKEAIGLIDFSRQYRNALANDATTKMNVAALEQTGAIVSMNRSIIQHLKQKDCQDRGVNAAIRPGRVPQARRSGDRKMKEVTVMQGSETTHIPGYDYGRAQSAHSPLSMEEFRQLEATVGWSEEDGRVLHLYGAIFQERAEEMVGSWRSVIGKQPHLAKWFFGPDGKPDEEYKAKVKTRFVQWVLDACFRPHDQAWLDYQEEIGLRHTPAKKNQTDFTHTPPVVPLRYLLGFTTVVTIATRKFFTDAGLTGQDLQKLEDAWAKAVLLHVTLWSRPYAKDGLW
jgi:hypothetical protein